MNNDKAIVLLNGRLGNLLFQIGNGLTYCRKYGKEIHYVIKDLPLTPISNYGWLFENFRTERCVDLKGESFSVFLEDQKKSPSPHEYRKGHVIFDGYFQSEVYLDSDYIREVFKLDEKLRNRLLERYIGITEGVGVSIRRGDYLKYPSIFNVMSKKYYEDMYDRYFRGLKCFITSDDVEWCSNNVEIENAEYIDENDEDTMRCLSLCKHHILSCSTYSWWSAWLEERVDSINIIPKPWYKAESGLCTELIVPERWKQVEISEDYVV